MEVTKTKHIEEWEIKEMFPYESISYEMKNEQEILITIFGYDGNIIEEIDTESFNEETYSNEASIILKKIGLK